MDVVDELLWGQSYETSALLLESSEFQVDLGRLLSCAVGEAGDIAFVQKLVQRAIPGGYTLDSMLRGACNAGREDLVRYLLRRFPQMDSDIDIAQCLEEAASGGHLQVLLALLEITGEERDQALAHGIDREGADRAQANVA